MDRVDDMLEKQKRSQSTKKENPEEKVKKKNKRFKNLDEYEKLKIEAKANVP